MFSKKKWRTRYVLFNWACGSESRHVIRIQEGKNYLQKKKKMREISCFDDLDVLFEGLEASDCGAEVLHIEVYE
jgi:hypothetical protein